MMKKIKMREMLRLSFGEEVGNSTSHGVMALLYLLALPFVSVYTYTKGGVIYCLGASVYMISIFLMFLTSTIYHAMEFGSSQKYVLRKLDHCFIYLAIAGTYTPVLLMVIKGAWGIVLLVLEWAAVLAGVLMTSISKYHHRILSMVIYVVMGWTAIIIAPALYHKGLIFFLLILLGGIFYTLGLIFYAKKYPFAHFVWHIFIILASIAHFIAIVFFI